MRVDVKITYPGRQRARGARLQASCDGSGRGDAHTHWRAGAQTTDTEQGVWLEKAGGAQSAGKRVSGSVEGVGRSRTRVTDRRERVFVGGVCDGGVLAGQQKAFGRRPGSRTADGGWRGETEQRRCRGQAVGFLVNKD
ncbi:hypothetical protein V6N13_049052 [Hibiscus sabdariffa]|uniref:Uncharacterized protein n=1 Tax=Hibiscus sabdariffa TaxID=183260 RepID=A0ABR2QYC4_9ROSI